MSCAFHPRNRRRDPTLRSIAKGVLVLNRAKVHMMQSSQGVRLISTPDRQKRVSIGRQQTHTKSGVLPHMMWMGIVRHIRASCLVASKCPSMSGYETASCFRSHLRMTLLAFPGDDTWEGCMPCSCANPIMLRVRSTLRRQNYSRYIVSQLLGPRNSTAASYSTTQTPPLC